MARGTLYSFLRGEKRLDPHVATILGEITDKSAREWIEMQHEHDLADLSAKID
jgi:plasmid maintenance system antidote protein VapI